MIVWKSWRPVFCIFLLLICVAAVAFYFNREDSTVPRPIITLTTHLADHASRFLAENDVDAQSQWQSEASGELYSDSAILSFAAHANRPKEPDGYILRYKQDDCEVALPPGRVIIISHRAGFFMDMSSTLPLEPLPFDEALALAVEIGESFDQAGWERIRYRLDKITHETFGEYAPGRKPAAGPLKEMLGDWVLCNQQPFRVHIQMKNFRSLPPGPATPPVPGRRLPDDAPDNYIIEVMFRSDGLVFDNELAALRDARRLEVNGDENEQLTLKLWIDDPDWRPEGWQGKFIK